MQNSTTKRTVNKTTKKATNKMQEQKQIYHRGIIHSSEKVKYLIDSRLKDIQTITNKSISQIIEEALIDNLFCKNDDARSIMINTLYSTNEDRIKQTMIAVFNLNLVGDKKYNIRPFIEYLLLWAFQDDVVTLTEEDHSKFLSLYKKIIEQIEKYAQQHKYEIENWEEIKQDNFEAAVKNTDTPYKDCRPPWWWWNYQQQTEWANKLYQLDSDALDRKLHLRYHLQVLWDFWDALADYDITYTYLIHIATIAAFRETATARNEICNILKEVSEEWEPKKSQDNGER